MEPKYPDYPCVALLGTTRQKAEGKSEVFADEIMYFPISSVVDLEHVDQMRRFKNFSVLGYNGLDAIEKRAPYKKGEVATIKSRLDAMANPPEMKRKLEAATAEIEALKSKLAAVAEKANASVESPEAVKAPVVEVAKASKASKSAAVV